MGFEFTNMLSWWQWGLLGAVPPAIVLLYFLKLRRVPLQVPSTYLWRKSIEDLHVNSIWQRLRRNLLLFLQLLLVALVMLALRRPAFQGSKLTGGRFIFAIDNSASMTAVDIEPSRLEDAKRRVLAAIDEMSTGDVAMVVTFADGADVAQPFTDNRQELRRSVESIQPTDEPTSLDEAMRVASGLANPSRSSNAQDARDLQVAAALPARIFIFTDGKFPPVENFSLGALDPVYTPIGAKEPANVGIVAFAAERNEEKPEEHQAFVNVQNFGPAPATVDVSLSLDGEQVGGDQVQVEPGKSAGSVFKLENLDHGVLEARISPVDGEDRLAIDDVAWAAINPRRRGKVLLISPGSGLRRFGLKTRRVTDLVDIQEQPVEFLKTDAYRQAAGSGAYDLVIYDRCAPDSPAEMPRSNTWFIGQIPPGGTWAALERMAVPSIIDTDRTHPLMQLVNVDNVLFREAAPLKPPAGSTTLIDSDKGPLFAIAGRESFEDAVLGFELDEQEPIDTNWPIKLSFPVFSLNLVQYLGGVRDALAAGTLRPGQEAIWRSDAAGDSVTVVPPGGEPTKVARTGQDAFRFTATQKAGIYEVQGEGEAAPTLRFAVNLMDPAESDIRPNDTLKVGDVNVTGDAQWESSGRDAWKYLAMAALAVLFVEWYIYNRRVYI
jgi:hypothetical protein